MLSRFHRHAPEFESLPVFTDRREIPRPDSLRLSNPCGERIASLEAKDDLRRKPRQPTAP